MRFIRLLFVLTLAVILLAIALVALNGPSVGSVIAAITIPEIPRVVRLVRAVVLAAREEPYVEAAIALGTSMPKILVRHLVPNTLAPLIVQATLSFSSAVLDAAALGFLGMGAQPPAPEWGTMLAEAREFILRAWWVVTLPGLAILVSVLAINMMGDGLRDALDPKLKRS